jgi:hypothetical protein
MPSGGRSPYLVGDHPQNLRQIGLVDHSTHIHLALALRAFRSQDVALESKTALYLAGTCLLEALGGATVSLHLRHFGILKTTTVIKHENGPSGQTEPE